MVGCFRIFTFKQPALLLSERQDSFYSVCCRRADSGMTMSCIRTSDKASRLWQKGALSVLCNLNYTGGQRRGNGKEKGAIRSDRSQNFSIPLRLIQDAASDLDLSRQRYPDADRL